MLYEDRVARFRWNVPATFNFAGDVVDVWAEDRGRVALVWEDDRGRELRLTFWDVAERSRRFANALRVLGVSRGDAVLLALPAVPEREIALLATLRLGALAVFVMPPLTAEAIASRAGAGVRAVVAGGEALAAIDVARGESPSPGILVAAGDDVPAGWRPFGDLVRDASRRIPPVVTRSDEPALRFDERAGSAGTRSVLHGHGYTWAHRYTAEYWLDLRPTDLHWTLSGEPFCGGSLAPWSLGAPVFLYDGPLDAKTTLALLEKHGISTLCATSAGYRALAGEDLSGRDLARLRHCAASGGPLDAATLLHWRDVLGLTLHEGYGKTETTLLVANVKGLPVRPGSAGKPFPGHDVRVIDEGGEERETGETGEVALRGRPPSRFLGYGTSAPAADSGAAADGYRTGDLAARDEQGYFWFEGSGGDAGAGDGGRSQPREREPRRRRRSPGAPGAGGQAAPRS